MNRVRVLYFHTLRTAAGCDAEEIDMRDGATIADLIAEVARRHPALASPGAWLLIAQNQQYARREEALLPGAEIALMPPVSGG